MQHATAAGERAGNHGNESLASLSGVSQVGGSRADPRLGPPHDNSARCCLGYQCTNSGPRGPSRGLLKTNRRAQQKPTVSATWTPGLWRAGPLLVCVNEHSCAVAHWRLARLGGWTGTCFERETAGDGPACGGTAVLKAKAALWNGWVHLHPPVVSLRQVSRPLFRTLMCTLCWLYGVWCNGVGMWRAAGWDTHRLSFRQVSGRHRPTALVCDTDSASCCVLQGLRGAPWAVRLKHSCGISPKRY